MVITPEHWDAWLNPTLSDVHEIRALMAPPAAGTLEVYPVSTAVNNVRNNGSGLVERIPA
jgi:putative SOS response-associated peptidase YedK